MFLYRSRWVALVWSATLLMSCDDTKSTLTAIDDDKNVPTLEIDSLHINYTQSGLMRMTLQAPLMQRFMLVDEPYNLFPKGIYVRFYTATNELESEIIADYAYNKEKPEEFWQAVGNVVVRNLLKEQTLYTDTLYWNRAQKTLHTDAPVKIVTPDGEINGSNGMTSDERFEDYEIRAIRHSHVYVNDEADADSTGGGPVAVEPDPALKTDMDAPPAVDTASQPIRRRPLMRQNNLHPLPVKENE